ncbi:hypothetical protein DdX_06463 [Ditylenchus destructor]|uniref:Uncharacterized protein n=1 Tax=Ditylenchus destructor TaxID=166010 RepID=A0AAD4N962_9BILA|nr:hypothetical protein DdX_06463 [Ditylenchus destructor]
MFQRSGGMSEKVSIHLRTPTATRQTIGNFAAFCSLHTDPTVSTSSDRPILYRFMNRSSKLKSCERTSSISSATTLKMPDLFSSKRLLLPILLLYLAFTPFAFSREYNSLPVCTAIQACAAELGHYPLLSETVGNMVEMSVGHTEGSGHEGSGQDFHLEESFPLYDEFVTRETLFDFQADPDLTHTQICRCPKEGEESENQCDFLKTNEESENVMKVDATLRLAFCKPVNQLFKAKCRGRRGLIRIIGDVDAKTGDAITSVNNTAVFCRCDSGHFQRTNIEPWMDKYAFTYRCEWSAFGNI